MLPRQSSYVPVVPVIPGTGGLRRSGYGSSLRGGPFRLIHTPIPNGAPIGSMGGGTRGAGRKPIPHRHMNGNVEDRRYHSTGGINTTGGVFVYLPPEMAAAYQSRGINLVPARPTMGRRRTTIERRGTPRASSSVEPGKSSAVSSCILLVRDIFTVLVTYALKYGLSKLPLTPNLACNDQKTFDSIDNRTPPYSCN